MRFPPRAGVRHAGTTGAWVREVYVAETDAEARDKAVHGWLVGSPQAVTEKLRQMYDDIGGCECLLVLPFDHSEITLGGQTHSAYWLRRSCH